jgi:hypothetical protein
LVASFGFEMSQKHINKSSKYESNIKTRSNKNSDQDMIDISSESDKDQIEEISRGKLDPGLTRWSILFRYERSQQGFWIRKRVGLIQRFRENFGIEAAVILPKSSRWISFDVEVNIKIQDFYSESQKEFETIFKWRFVRCLQASQTSALVTPNIQNDLALITSPTSSEGRVFWQLICKRYNLSYIGFREKPLEPYGFGIRSKYQINTTSVAGREFRFSSTGTSLLIKTKLYAICNNQQLIIEDLTDEDSEENWTIKGGIYREVLYKVFEFYQTFDLWDFDFPDMERGEYNDDLRRKLESIGEIELIEDGDYGKDYDRWKKGIEKEEDNSVEIKEEEHSVLSQPIATAKLEDWLNPADPSFKNVPVIFDTTLIQQNNSRDPRLFPEYIVRKKLR